MCFSVEADLVAGVVLLPVGVLSLREVRRPREVPFAALPLLFALHQLVEALVWAGESGAVSPCVQQGAALAYVLFAVPVLPVLLPVAVLLLEPRGPRLRVAPFVVVGAALSVHLLIAVLDGPLVVEVQPHALVYLVDTPYLALSTVLYVAVVVGPSVLSGYRSIVVFGLANLAGLSIVGVLYVQAFASLWCVWAATSSVLVLVHMRRRRGLSRGHQMDGDPLHPRPAGRGPRYQDV